MQVIKVTEWHSVCVSYDLWLFLCLCQQSNGFTALFRKAPNCVPLPKLVSFRFKVPGLLWAAYDKHLYLSWECASSQLEGWSAADFCVLYWRMIKQTVIFINSKEAVWCSRVCCQLHQLNQNHCFVLFVFLPSIYCCGLASTQLCFEDIYWRPWDLSIRQHPLPQPLLTALCEAKPNQMCVKIDFYHSFRFCIHQHAVHAGFCSSCLQHHALLFKYI